MNFINLFSSHFRFKKALLALFIILFILSLFANFYLFFKYNKERILIVKPQTILDDKTSEIPDKVSKLMHLPQDEKPQVFPITEKTPRNQAFIGDAKNGDILLLYLKNQKAVLFDPVKNKIIKIGPINISTISAELNKN